MIRKCPSTANIGLAEDRRDEKTVIQATSLSLYIMWSKMYPSKWRGRQKPTKAQHEKKYAVENSGGALK